MLRDLAHRGAARPRVHARSATLALDLIDSHGQAVTAAGLYGSLAVIYGWFGGMKFTRYEAEGLVSLVSNNPLLSWTYSLFSVEGFSNLLGFLELSIAVLIVARLIKPIYSLVGGLLSAGLFATTLSFMATTPGCLCLSSAFRRSPLRPGSFCSRTPGSSPSLSGSPSTRLRRSVRHGPD